jgi:hypothetical protein
MIASLASWTLPWTTLVLACGQAGAIAAIENNTIVARYFTVPP